MSCSYTYLSFSSDDMDERSNCGGRSLNVDDNGIRLQGRGNTAPSNPPTTCTIYLLSTYREEDGSNKLQIEIENYNVQDCALSITIFNGHGFSGGYVGRLGCGRPNSLTLYSTMREVTIKMDRPLRMTHNEYQFSLLIKPWKDHNALSTRKSVNVLSVGVIIGIVLGCLVVITLCIVFCWCCCTGLSVCLLVACLCCV